MRFEGWVVNYWVGSVLPRTKRAASRTPDPDGKAALILRCQQKMQKLEECIKEDKAWEALQVTSAGWEVSCLNGVNM